MKIMNYEREFDRNAFMEYIHDTFNMNGNGFAERMIENIIDYAYKHEHVSRDQFADFIAELIPDVEFGEVAAFCEDSCLTTYGIKAKHDFWNEKEC